MEKVRGSKGARTKKIEETPSNAQIKPIQYACAHNHIPSKPISAVKCSSTPSYKR